MQQYDAAPAIEHRGAPIFLGDRLQRLRTAGIALAQTGCDVREPQGDPIASVHQLCLCSVDFLDTTTCQQAQAIWAWKYGRERAGRCFCQVREFRITKAARQHSEIWEICFVSGVVTVDVWKDTLSSAGAARASCLGCPANQHGPDSAQPRHGPSFYAPGPPVNVSFT